ncbi:MAG: hypothetical protein HY078_06870 [Elusimicrobia bacterium]|nr:hypothetical protein [Elusimicrobiota bacterium]
MIRAASLLALLTAAAPPCAAAPKAPAPASAPDRVTVGAFLNDIQNLDIKTHSYAADLYLWFRWKNPKINPAATAEFMNAYELWGHEARPAYEKPIKRGDELYQVVHYQGRFAAKLDLERYPFDKQKLFIEVEDAQQERQSIEYVLDADGFTVNPNLRLPGFIIKNPTLTIRDNAYPTRFGDTALQTPSVFSRLRLEIPVERPALTYSVKLFLPVMCVVLCASLMLLFDPKWVDARVGIGITALLTIVALQITFNNDLPQVDYLVLMDKVYLTGYLFVIAGLAVVLKTTQVVDTGRGAAAARWEHRALGLLLAAFLAALLLLLIL